MRSCIWLSGTLTLPSICFVVHSREGRLLRQTAGSVLEPYAAFGDLAEGLWNEIVVDGRGNAYVNGGCIALVTPDDTAPGSREIAPAVSLIKGCIDRLYPVDRPGLGDTAPPWEPSPSWS